MELNAILKHYADLRNKEREDMKDELNKQGDKPTMKDRATKLNITVGQATDVLFSHNEIIALWYEPKSDPGFKHEIYHGEAWATPKEYQDLNIINFFGSIPEHISEADRINILVVANEDTLTPGLKPEYPDRSNCSDGEETSR